MRTIENVLRVFFTGVEPEGIGIKEFRINHDILRDIAERAGVTLTTNTSRTRLFAKIKPKKIVLSNSIARTRTIKFACISDIHAGYINCNYKKLTGFLNKCLKEGVEFIFIAGDLFEGIYNRRINIVSDTPEGQAEILYEYLKDFPFLYIAISGNHDYTFEVNGLRNPIEILAEMLNQDKCKAEMIYLDTFIADVVIKGLNINLVHLHKKTKWSKTAPCIGYAKWYVNEIMDKDIPTLAIIAGHVHEHSMYEWSNIQIFQPGSIRDNKDIEEHMGYIVEIEVFMVEENPIFKKIIIM